MCYLLQTGVVRVPGDDRYAQVTRQLEEVLRRGGVPSVGLVFGHIQNRWHVLRQEAVAQGVQDSWQQILQAFKSWQTDIATFKRWQQILQDFKSWLATDIAAYKTGQQILQPLNDDNKICS